tara:strand:+ start:434 stop:1591 length:1158 start_codon:yes stop_codon:yes gene_type:complete
LNNSTGGQLLRIKTSIKSLNRIASLDVVSRNPRYQRNIRQDYLKKINLYYAPSVKNILSKNKLIKAFQWRFNEFFFLKDDAKYIAKLVKKKQYDLVWISFASQSYFLIKEIKKLDKKIKIVADTDSVYFKFIEREIKYVNLFKKIIIFLYSLIYKSIEKKMIKISDFTTAVSNYDKKTFENLGLKKKIFIFRNTIEAIKKNSIYKNKDKFNIIISGSFGSKTSPMNVSVKWFLDSIFPKIEKKIKNLRIYLIGIGSDKFLEDYNLNKEIIISTGWVKSIKKYFYIADLAVVPLLYESGTRFKILEAAMYKIPVISTKIGAEGLPLKNNESIFLEDDPKKFANKIISISKNNKILRKIGIKSNYMVLQNFSIKAQINDAKKLLKYL